MLIFYIFASLKHKENKISTGCGAARLAHWSGGPGVAGSNPVIPTVDNQWLTK
jgi:hypothetical protein